MQINITNSIYNRMKIIGLDHFNLVYRKENRKKPSLEMKLKGTFSIAFFCFVLTKEETERRSTVKRMMWG